MDPTDVATDKISVAVLAWATESNIPSWQMLLIAKQANDLIETMTAVVIGPSPTPAE